MPAHGERSRNWLPAGAALHEDYGQDGVEFFYDMYFGCESSWEGNDTLVYPFHGCDVPDLRAGDVLVHGDYEEGIRGYKILKVDRDNEGEVLTVKVRPVASGDLPGNLSTTFDLRTQKPLYTKVWLPDGRILKLTTDERFFAIKGNRDKDLQLDRGEAPNALLAQQQAGTIADAKEQAVAQAVTWPNAIDLNKTNVDLATLGYESFLFGSEPYASQAKYGTDFSVTLNNLILQFTPSIDLGWTGGGLSPLTEMHATTTASFTFKSDATVDIKGAGTWQYKRTIASYQYWFSVGWVLCSAKFDINVAPYISAGGKVKFSAGVQANFSETFGLKWDNVSSWQPVLSETFKPSLYNSQNSSTNLPNIISADSGILVSAGLKVEPKLGLYILGITGPAITMEMGPKFEFNYKDASNWDWGVYGCIKAAVEVDLGIPALGLNGYTWSHDLYNLDYPGYTCKEGCCLLFPTYDASNNQVRSISGQFSYAGAGGGQPGQDDSTGASNTDGTAVRTDGNTVTNTPLIARPTLSAPADMSFKSNTTTGTLRPTFTWSAVSGATKYNIMISQLSYEVTGTSFQPGVTTLVQGGTAPDLPPGIQVPWRVRAYYAGRYGDWSDVWKANVGITISTGNSYYGKLDVGNRVDVTDPRTGAVRTFWLYDLNSSTGDIYLRFTNNGSWVDLVVNKSSPKGPAQIGSDFGLFVYPVTVFDGGASGRFSELMIAPYFTPDLRITAPVPGKMNGAIVKVDATYLGKDVPWRDIGDPPKWTTDIAFRKLYYCGDGTTPCTSNCTSETSYVWTMSGAAGARTMTVTLTDLLGQSVSKSVTVYYDPTMPFYVYRGPYGDDWTSWSTYCYNNNGQCAGFRASGQGYSIDNTFTVGWMTDKSQEIGRYIDYGFSTMCSYNVPAGATTVFVVDKSQYFSTAANFPLCQFPAITYHELYDALARYLGRDSAGNYRVWASTSAATRSVADAIKDAAPPTVTITDPRNGSYTNATSITVGGTAGDDYALVKLEYGVTTDGSKPTTWTSFWTGNVTSTSWSTSVPLTANKVNTIWIRATEATGYGDKTTTASVSVTCDTTPSTITIKSPTSNASLSGPGGCNVIPVSGYAYDSVGLSKVEVSVNGGPWISSSRLVHWSVNVPLAGGTNKIIARATDLAGNQSYAEITVFYSPSYPQLTDNVPLPAPISNSFTNEENLTDSNEGTSVFLGGYDTSQESVYDFGGIVPSLKVTSVGNFYSWQSCDCTAQGAGFTLTYYGSKDKSTWTQFLQQSYGWSCCDGCYTINFRDSGTVTSFRYLKISAHAWQACQSSTVRLNIQEVYLSYNACPYLGDTTAPTLTISSPSNGLVTSNPSLTVSGTASDSGTGVWGVEVSLNGGAWQMASGTTSWSASLALVPGSNTIAARAFDATGNMTTASIGVTYDNEPPKVGITSPANGSTVCSSSLTVSGVASDNTSVAKVEVSVNGGAYALASGTTSWSQSVTLVLGWNTITAKATDGVGNTSAQSITVFYGVPAAPTGVTASTNLCDKVQVSWSAATGATSYNVLRGTTCGTVVNTFTNVTSPYNDTSAVAGTSYQYWVVAVNSCGTSGNSACATGMRTAPPSAPALSSPGNWALFVSKTLTLSWGSVTGAASYEVQVSTSSTFSTIARSATVTSTSWTVSPALNGLTWYYWRVRAKDACGQAGSWSSVRIFYTTL